MRLLLVSNSTLHGQNYLDHCMPEMLDFLGGVRRIVFIPFALFDRDAYAAKARERFALEGIDVASLHATADPHALINDADAFFTGGGNTFRLLKTLYDLELLDAIRTRVNGGALYMGSSAGTNIATVSIRTTNDMPIVWPPSLDALGFVPFNINPHYLDPDPDSTHMGETREQRIREFHEENTQVVVGLREGCWLRREAGVLSLGGTTNARIFRRGEAPEEVSPGADLSYLLT